MPRKPRHPTEEENALWRDATRDDVPLPPSSRPVPPVSDRRVWVEAGEVPAPPAMSAMAFDAPFVVGDLTMLNAGDAGKLRRGEWPIDRSIDLHGLRQEAAWHALHHAVLQMAGEGRRLLLVVTGKGNSSEGGGVLRRQLPGWLASEVLAPYVLTVATAHVRHGGSGAFYVLLTRQRS